MRVRQQVKPQRPGRGVDVDQRQSSLVYRAQQLHISNLVSKVNIGTAPSSVDSRGVNFRPRLRPVCGAVRTLSG